MDQNFFSVSPSLPIQDRLWKRTHNTTATMNFWQGSTLLVIVAKWLFKVGNMKHKVNLGIFWQFKFIGNNTNYLCDLERSKNRGESFKFLRKATDKCSKAVTLTIPTLLLQMIFPCAFYLHKTSSLTVLAKYSHEAPSKPHLMLSIPSPLLQF